MARDESADFQPGQAGRPGHTPGPDDKLSPTERRVREAVRGTRPGNTHVRISRPQFRGFERRGPGHLEAGLEIERPRGWLGALRRALIGEPIHSAEEMHERLSKRKAIAVFSSDALSSVAYAPQETLVILAAAGAAGLAYSLPISIAVVILLATVVTSYRQTIYAYPKGGGSYIVARSNLGPIPGLVAGSALAMGYILTVSVSIASSIDQLVSAIQVLSPYRVGLAVAAIVLVSIANLRGMRESGNIFAVPTYAFLVSMYALIGVGLVLLVSGNLRVAPPVEVERDATTNLSLFLLLRAFAVGSAVMTGTEAISDGVMAFKPPESRNAARTLVAMACILASMFLGMSVLIHATGLVPGEEQTVISQLAVAVFGLGPLYYVVQFSATLILVLAANTAYADFPRLFSFLARDDFAPHQLAFRGERLAFSNGIILLGALSALLVILFSGQVGALLPLYAVCVFLAFTLSQSGMVRHWWRLRGPHWRTKSTVNGIGASVTALVALIAAVTNLSNPNHPIIAGLAIGWGSWLILVIIPLLIWVFLKIHRHYAEVRRAMALPADPALIERPFKNVVVVTIARLGLPTVRALAFARSLSPSVVAVHVTHEPEEAQELEEAWQTWGHGVPLVVVESPYRSLTGPLLQFLGELKRVEQADYVTVVVPEYLPDRWWEHFLHGQTAQFLKLALLFRPGFIVTSVPSHERAGEPRSTVSGGA